MSDVGHVLTESEVSENFVLLLLIMVIDLFLMMQALHFDKVVNCHIDFNGVNIIMSVDFTHSH